MIDFSTARQCWLAAYWGAQSLGGVLDSPAPEEEAPGHDQLKPTLAIYGADRVLPVLVLPIYDWLIRSLSAAVVSVGEYYKVDQKVVADIQNMLNGSVAWCDQLLSKGDDARDLEVDGIAMLAVEWLWMQRYWQSQGESIANLVQDISTIRNRLPFIGNKQVAEHSLPQADEPSGEGGAVPVKWAGSSNAAALDRTISIKQVLAWDPSLVDTRITIANAFLKALGDRWAES